MLKLLITSLTSLHTCCFDFAKCKGCVITPWSINDVSALPWLINDVSVQASQLKLNIHPNLHTGTQKPKSSSVLV